MGFAPQWLALREPADRAARDGGLLAHAARLAGPSPVIVDLGAGTGASLRALAPHVPAGAQWRLVDNDRALLAHAVAAHPQARPFACDLTNLADLPLSGATLVSASALLDLVSENWVRDLAQLLARHKLPFYAALSYDGVMTWQPQLAGDDAVTGAFNTDQCTDKGFGPALGPAAWSCARQVFTQAGYDVFCAPSPWVLGRDDAPLQAQLLDGIATAAARAGYTGAQAWHDARQALVPRGQCLIGHQDILAVPEGLVAELGADGGV
ncbi:class I SAM-dependent methyltransferase [Roseinatronobacter sp. NSM]|uniref:class I SAM-dependent methyltransferase n=1 Tax=Roseinatronobacter sp. NSM TaxID=3457785 RepID=UPI0040352FF8